jgi:hypothetical protein
MSAMTHFADSNKRTSVRLIETAWHPPFSERTLWNIGSELLSLRLDVGRDNHLAPFFGLVGDELAEIGGRACEHRAT